MSLLVSEDRVSFLRRLAIVPIMTRPKVVVECSTCALNNSEADPQLAIFRRMSSKSASILERLK